MTVRQIVFNGLSMAVIMSVCMSLAMAIINVGFGPHFMTAWLTGTGIGFVVSLPLSFIMPPLLMKIMARLKI
jgi:hypothetical protein